MKRPGVERFVDFRNPKGKTLRGMVHLPHGAVKHDTPGAVFFHGFTGDRMESHWIFVKCSRVLAQAGIASLRFDFYGSGESDGDFREMSLRGEIGDGRAAVALLREQPEIDAARVGLLGLSLGGAVAAALASGVQAKALVLWSAVAHTSRLRDLMKQSTKKIAGTAGATEYNGHELSPRLIDDVLKVEPIRHLARFKGPTLIVHAEKDEAVPLSHAHDFVQAAGAEVKELAIISEADHVFTNVPWENEVIARTLRWFGRYL